MDKTHVKAVSDVARSAGLLNTVAAIGSTFEVEDFIAALVGGMRPYEVFLICARIAAESVENVVAEGIEGHEDREHE